MATDSSVVDFIEAAPEKKREDSYALIDLMRDITGEEATMWGTSIVGFGSYHYVYESGREGDMPLAGFSPRSAKFSLYIMAGFSKYEDILARLGKHKIGKSCLYINKLADVDMDVLRELISQSVAHVREKYPVS